MTPPPAFVFLLDWFVDSGALFMVSSRPLVPGLRGSALLLRLLALLRVSMTRQFSPTLLHGGGQFFCCMWMT